MSARLIRFAVAAVALLIAACAPQVPPPLPAPPTPPLVMLEEEVRPVEKLELVITDLTETPSPDRKTVTVTGTLVNRGERATRELYVHVEALDRNGAVVLSADPLPSTKVIAPGATGSFSVTFENRPDVDRYHVEAIGR